VNHCSFWKKESKNHYPERTVVSRPAAGSGGVCQLTLLIRQTPIDAATATTAVAANRAG
jgi:hypothetical protein